jgi:anti-sigma regulatory factor (Ser/Thr protein kinase)
VCNIIDHGYSEGTSDIIKVSMQLQSRKLIVEISDHAQSIPQAVAEKLCSRSVFVVDSRLPDVMDIPESGRGMGIMSTLASEIEYDAQPDQNRLTLRFDL